MRVESGQTDAEFKQNDRPNSESDSGSDLSISDILRMLGRHKWFIAICTVVCVLASYFYAKSVTPIYEASASIRIDPSRASSLGLNDLLSGGGGYDDSEMMKTEIAILQSDAVAIDTLNSLTDAEFESFAKKPKSTVMIPQGAAVLTPAQETLLGNFKGSLSAHQAEGTQLVTVTFRSPNADVAAMMANRAVAAYLRQSFDSRYGSVGQVAKWLSTQMDSLKDRASEAQRKLASFQEKNSILGSDAANNTTIDRLRLLNTRLAEAQADRIVKEAQMRAAMTGNPQVLAAMFPNPDLSSLEGEQGTLYSQYAQMSTKFGPNYPPLADLKRQMQKIDAEVEHQVGSVRDRMKQEYQASAATEKMLQTEYEDQTSKAYALNRQQAEYAVLQAEGSSSRDLYDTLQYKLQQAGVDAGLNGVNTMLVDTARAPRFPIEPKKRLIVTFGLVLGLFAGLGSAFLREAATDNVQDAEQIERVMGYHLLALIPHLNLSQPGAKGAAPVKPAAALPMLTTYMDPLSRDAEAYRSMRNSLLLSSIDHPYKTMLVTSTLPGEGKSNTSSNYSVVLAQRGSRVLAIDGDLRRPTLHERFGIENNLGLSNMILGELAEEPFVQPFADLPNLHVLTAGKKVPLPSEALSSSKFYSLLKKWESEFDYIVIDSAPLLIVSDSLPMASWADALILVARYNTTPIRALKRVRDILNRTNANVAGVIINDVSETGASYGGYGYGYGYGDYYN